MRERVQLRPHAAAEHRDERGLVRRRDLADGRDADAVQLLGRDVPDSPQTLDGKRVQERELAVGRHDEQAVRLRNAARDLGEELRARDADRDRETDMRPSVAPQSHGDVGRRARQAAHAAHVEECLVDRKPLDDRRRVLEDAEERLARVRVRGHARRDDDRVGAETARLPSTHRGANAVRLRLVARGKDDAGADDHRPPAQSRIVSLLDRRVEGVDVSVQDRRLVLVHERMFAHAAVGWR